MAAWFLELSGNCAPTRHDRRSSSLQSLRTAIKSTQEIRRAFRQAALLLHLASRHASLGSSVNSILLRCAGLSPHRALGRVRCNAKLLQMRRELLAPMAQRCLSDIQPHALLALGFDDQVHVRMRFVGMQYECVPVLECKLIDGEFAHGGEHRLRGRPRRHRKDEVVHELG